MYVGYHLSKFVYDVNYHSSALTIRFQQLVPFLDDSLFIAA